MNKNRLSLTHAVLIAMVLPVSIFIVSMLLGCNSPHNSKYISVANDGCPQFEKQFPMKQATIGSLFSGKEDGCPEVIEYSSMAEAEWKMIHYFFPNGKPETLFWAEFDYDLFKQIVLSDTSSMTYPFDSLMQYANITISDSDDGQLRAYSWEPGHDWQLSDYHNVFQYRWEGAIKTCEPECEGEDCTQAGTNAINTFIEMARQSMCFQISFLVGIMPPPVLSLLSFLKKACSPSNSLKMPMVNFPKS